MFTKRLLTIGVVALLSACGGGGGDDVGGEYWYVDID